MKSKKEIEQLAFKEYPPNLVSFMDGFEDSNRFERNAYINDYTKCQYEKQSEGTYNEEDLREAFRQGQDNMVYDEIYGFDSKLTEQQWFEQFKK
jgi:hypothetical protein